MKRSSQPPGVGEPTGPAAPAEPTDPDVDLRVPAQRAAPWRAQVPVVGVVALGGAIGASVRYGASLAWPVAEGGFPWTTLWVNGAGCAVIGVFMVVISDAWAAHRLVRPFFGTGVLGGFTTFSTYAVDVERLVDGGRARTGLLYLGLTPVIALAAVWSAAWLTRRAVAWRAWRQG
ncbi:fluoride efflux transporter CrcB [Streptomyces sp. LP05-1]|uniref:Fluoride-specific ion channel FluC n=1 Tax=Streptomyces pyxinae TaxID=2970734 RepID=A0ABT2CNV6_9ACTN|nr:fluoride efflux transporter CrcB [Streptomyces sp. LP05-1]MCS0639116.1 fluoride efflux transporter CrcB [Streptomyces sp. LP05-1]